MLASVHKMLIFSIVLQLQTEKKKNKQKPTTTNKQNNNNEKDCRYKFILKYSQVKMTESHHNNYISQPFKITFFRKLLVIVFIYGYFQEKHV